MDDDAVLTLTSAGYLMQHYQGNACVAPFYNMSETDIYSGSKTMYVGAAIMRNFYFTIYYDDEEIAFMTSANAPNTTSVADYNDGDGDDDTNVTTIVLSTLGVALIGGLFAVWMYCRAKKAQQANNASEVGEENADVTSALYKNEPQESTYGTPVNELY